MAVNDQQFCLRWNNHQSTLISVFDSLLENGTLVDCTIAAEGQYLKAHKVVLSACSPYLEVLLSQHYEKHPIVILKDVKFSELKSMMDYMYKGEVNISQDQLGTFLKAAESLQIKGLSDNGDEGAVGSSAPKKDPPARPSVTQTRAPAESKRPAPSGDVSDASRDGSISPSSIRKRRRTRRPSQGDDPDNHFDSSNVCDPAAQSTPMPVPNVTVPTPVIPKQIVKQEPNLSINDTGLKKEIIDPPTEPLLEPKTEYLDYMNNENSIEVEDLTLDDDDDLDSSMDASRPGPSHGDMSNQGYQWPMTGDQSGTDEIFMAAQEAVGAATAQQQRDSQGPTTTSVITTSTAVASAAEVLTELATAVPIQTTLTPAVSVTPASSATPTQATNAPLQDIVLQDQSGNIIKILKIYSPAVDGKKKGEKEVEKLLGATEIDSLTASIATIASRDELFDVQVANEEVAQTTTIQPGIFEFSQVVECSSEKPDEEQSDEGDNAGGEIDEAEDPNIKSIADVEKYIQFLPDLGRFKCLQCEKMYRQKTTVANHLMNQCMKHERLKCNFCPYTAQKAVTLRIHNAKYHKGVSMFSPRTSKMPDFKTPLKVKKPSKATPKKDSDPDSVKKTPKSTPTSQRKPRATIAKTPTSFEDTGESPEASSSQEHSDHVNEFEYLEETEKWKCKTCHKLYKKKNHMEDHKFVNCKTVNLHSCFYCPYKGRTPTTVRVHIGKKHGKWPRLDENGVWIY